MVRGKRMALNSVLVLEHGGGRLGEAAATGSNPNWITADNYFCPRWLLPAVRLSKHAYLT